MHIKISMTKMLKFFLIAALTIVIVLNSGYALSTVNTNIGLTLLFLISILLAFFYLIYFMRCGKLSKSFIYFLGWTSILLIISLINFTNGNFIPMLRFISLLFVSYFITEFWTFEQFSSFYIRILLFITYISFPMYALSLFNKLTMLPIVQNINDVFYRNAYIYFELIHKSITRNCAIFWEPGIFSSFLIIGILLEIYVKKETSNKNLVIFSVGIFTTMSGAGISLWILTMALIIFQKMNRNMKYLYIVILFIGLGIIYMFFDDIRRFLLEWNYNFFIKFFSDNQSSTTRIMSPYNNFLIFKRSPIFGNGFVQSSYLYENMMTGNIVAQTSTTTQLMSIFGITGVLLHFIPIVNIFRTRKLMLFDKAIVSLILLIILNKEPHINFLASYIILAYLARLITREEINEKKIKLYE